MAEKKEDGKAAAKKKTLDMFKAELAGIHTLKDLNQYVVDVKDFVEMLSEKDRTKVVAMIKAKRETVPHIERVKVREHIRHTLTPAEKHEISDEMAQAQIDIEQAEGDKKATAAQFDGTIKSAKLVVSQRARTYRDGYEMRLIACEKVKDFHKKRVLIVRLDTQEIVKDRAMTVDEMQMSLPIDLI